MTTATEKKTAMKTYTGTITNVELKSRPARDNGRYGKEVYDVSALVRFTAGDGCEYWFYSPAARHTVNTSGLFSCSLVDPTDWITCERFSCDGVMGAKGFGRVPIARVKVGDRIKLKAKVKSGNQLWYAKRLDWSLDAELAAYANRVKATKSSYPPARVEFPLTPHDQFDTVEANLPTLPAGWAWRICGGPDGLYFADSELKSMPEFLAACEGVSVDQCQPPK